MHGVATSGLSPPVKRFHFPLQQQCSSPHELTKKALRTAVEASLFAIAAEEEWK